jgi:hypothetical protein
LQCHFTNKELNNESTHYALSIHVAFIRFVVLPAKAE